MIKITSQFTLQQKLRAHADNLSRGFPSVGYQWAMRDAANVIDALNLRMIKLEEAYEDANNRSREVGKGRS